MCQFHFRAVAGTLNYGNIDASAPKKPQAAAFFFPACGEGLRRLFCKAVDAPPDTDIRP